MEDLVVATVRKQHFMRSEGHHTEFSVFFESTTNISFSFSHKKNIYRSRNQRVEIEVTPLITSLSEALAKI